MSAPDPASEMQATAERLRRELERRWGRRGARDDSRPVGQAPDQNQQPVTLLGSEADVLDDLLRRGAAPEQGDPQAAIPIILDRARVFHAELEAAEPGPVPVFHVPGGRPPQPGGCLSCGDPIARGVRCVLCAMAARLALGLAEPSPVPGFPQGEHLEQAGQTLQRHLQSEAEAGRGVTRLAAETWLEAHGALSRR
jgi:hypothetical protein